MPGGLPGLGTPAIVDSALRIVQLPGPQQGALLYFLSYKGASKHWDWGWWQAEPGKLYFLGF